LSRRACVHAQSTTETGPAVGREGDDTSQQARPAATASRAPADWCSSPQQRSRTADDGDSDTGSSPDFSLSDDERESGSAGRGGTKTRSLAQLSEPGAAVRGGSAIDRLQLSTPIAKAPPAAQSPYAVIHEEVGAAPGPSAFRRVPPVAEPCRGAAQSVEHLLAQLRAEREKEIQLRRRFEELRTLRHQASSTGGTSTTRLVVGDTSGTAADGMRLENEEQAGSEAAQLLQFALEPPRSLEQFSPVIERPRH
jgi:hypothetical protein